MSRCLLDSHCLYTLPGVMAVNGSSANGGCPSPCVGVVSGITTCDCERIVIHNGASFPQFIRVFVDSIGSVTLTSDLQNCTSLTRVSIPLQMARNTTQYFIELTNPSGDLIEWVHIAEVRFSDQPITTTMMTTTESTTRELTTSKYKCNSPYCLNNAQ